jgi:hypothetical protein
LKRAHQRNAPGTRVPRAVGTSAVLSHDSLPCRPGGRTWFPGPVILSSQATGRLARADTCRAQNNYLVKLRSTISRAVTFLSIRPRALCHAT